jgi:hypothetical protein
MSRRRFAASYAFVAYCGCTVYIFLVGARDPVRDMVPSAIVGLFATALLHALLSRGWARLRRGWQRALACLAASWAVMNVVSVALLASTGDPFAAERIAEKGWLAWVLLDVVLRALLVASLGGTIAFVWAWLPLGLLWYLALALAHAPNEGTASPRAES